MKLNGFILRFSSPPFFFFKFLFSFLIRLPDCWSRDIFRNFSHLSLFVFPTAREVYGRVISNFIQKSFERNLEESSFDSWSYTENRFDINETLPVYVVFVLKVYELCVECEQGSLLFTSSSDEKLYWQIMEKGTPAGGSLLFGWVGGQLQENVC